MARRRKYKPIHERSRLPSLAWGILVVTLLGLSALYWYRQGADLPPGQQWAESQAADLEQTGNSWSSPEAATSAIARAFLSAKSRFTGSAEPAAVPESQPPRKVAVAEFWEFPMQAHQVSFSGELVPATAPPPPGFEIRPPRDDFEVQLALVRRGFSPGSIDGLFGPQTRAAVRAFQESQGLPATGVVDITTRSRLLLEQPPLTTYVVSTQDLARLRPVSDSWLGKSQQDRLDYESVLELVAEKGMAYPSFIRKLNPGVDWSYVPPGTSITIPFAYQPAVNRPAAFLRIHLEERILQAFDIRTNLIAHFPCSIGRVAAKRPVGRLEVKVIAENPNYTFNPAIYPESPEARTLSRKLIVPPGPNNPVGLAWLGLDRPGYGIHGTPAPENVGRTESHGCFRLANWNAAHLLQMSWVTMPVYIQH